MELLLLHGALGASDQFNDLCHQLDKEHTVHVLEFSGHGQQPAVPGGFAIGQFAQEVISWLDRSGKEAVDIFGYSMGGYVALYLARFYPQRVRSVITLATKFDWSPESAEKEVKLLDAEKISVKLPDFARALEARHSVSGWKTVLSNTAEMMLEMGRNRPLKDDDLSQISHRVLMLVGDRDKMVSLEETASAYRLLKNGGMAVLPYTPHPLEAVDANRLGALIRTFLGGAK